MKNNRNLKILAAMLALRAEYYRKRCNYDTAIAYDNAFDMLAYAAHENWDCLSQFEFAYNAADLIDSVGENIDFWELEEMIKYGKEEENGN